MKLLIKTIIFQSGIEHLFNSGFYQNWSKTNDNLRAMQVKIINISCLIIIGINLLVSLINFSVSYQFFGFISLLALIVLLLSKSEFFYASRWVFIISTNIIAFLLSAVYSHNTALHLMFILSITASLALFVKEEKIEFALSLCIPFILFIFIYFTGFTFKWNTNSTNNLFSSIFLINISCILLSVILAILQVFSIYEKSESNLKAVVHELQIREKEIKLQNDELLKLNSELISSQEDLLKSQMFLNTIIDNLPVMLFVKDVKDLKLIRLNKTGERLLKYSEKEVLSMNNFETAPQNNLQMYEQADSEVLRRGEIVEQEEYITNKNKEKYILHTKKVPIYDSKGEPLYLLGISEDITPRKQAEEALKRTVEELKTRNFELDNYVYRVSHDLRAPFCSMQGLINLAKLENNTENTTQYIKLIEQSVVKSDRFIQSILDHSKILNTDLQTNLIDFKKIVHESFEDNKYIEGAGQIKFITNISSAEFYNDEMNVAIIFRNIISNAIKYINPSVEDKFLKIDVEVTNTRAFISIEDNGLGIEKVHLPKIFDMFFRGNERSNGSGLGLYMAKQSVQKLDGEISVESTINQGTIFKIILNNYKP